MGMEAMMFYNRLGVNIAEKQENYASKTFIRAKSNFSMLRSALLCIRGSRIHKVQGVAFEDHDVTLVLTEAHIG